MKQSRYRLIALSVIAVLLAIGLYVWPGAAPVVSCTYGPKVLPPEPPAENLVAAARSGTVATPDDPWAWTGLGKAYWQTGDWKSAETAFGKARALPPKGDDSDGSVTGGLYDWEIYLGDRDRAAETAKRIEPHGRPKGFDAESPAGKAVLAVEAWVAECDRLALIGAESLLPEPPEEYFTTPKIPPMSRRVRTFHGMDLTERMVRWSALMAHPPALDQLERWYAWGLKDIDIVWEKISCQNGLLKVMWAGHAAKGAPGFPEGFEEALLELDRLTDEGRGSQDWRRMTSGLGKPRPAEPSDDWIRTGYGTAYAPTDARELMLLLRAQVLLKRHMGTPMEWILQQWKVFDLNADGFASYSLPRNAALAARVSETANAIGDVPMLWLHAAGHAVERSDWAGVIAACDRGIESEQLCATAHKRMGPDWQRGTRLPFGAMAPATQVLARVMDDAAKKGIVGPRRIPCTVLDEFRLLRWQALLHNGDRDAVRKEVREAISKFPEPEGAKWSRTAWHQGRVWDQRRFLHERVLTIAEYLDWKESGSR